MKPQKYDDLNYEPAYGLIEVRGRESGWAVRVPIDKGIDMEKDGVTVHWVYSQYPVWVVDIGAENLWTLLFRLWTWPQRVIAHIRFRR